MASINRPPFQGIIGASHDFAWQQKQKLELTSPSTAVVAVDVSNANFAGYSGKSVTITRGSTSTTATVTFG